MGIEPNRAKNYDFLKVVAAFGCGFGLITCKKRGRCRMITPVIKAFWGL